MITDAQFAEMTQRYFMAILAYRLARLFAQNPALQMVRIAN